MAQAPAKPNPGAPIPQATDKKTPKRTKDFALLTRFWQDVRQDRRWVWAGVVAVPLTSLCGLAQPWLVKEAIDGPIGAALGHRTNSAWSLRQLAVAFLFAVLGEYLFRSSQLYALQRAGYYALQRLRRRVFAHVLSQSAVFFDKRPTGTLLSRTVNDVEAIGEVLTFGIVGILGDLFDILSILAAMVLLDVRLTLMSLVAAPLIAIVVNFFRTRLRFYATEIRRSMAVASGFFQEALAGARIVQLQGRRQATSREYSDLNQTYLQAYKASNWYDASLYAVMDGVAGLCIAALIWYGSGRAVQGLVSVGLLVAFIQYIQRIFVPVRELSAKVATLERAMASLERIFGLLDIDEKMDAGTHAPDRVQGRITVDNLRFGYEPTTLALNGISLQIAPGEVVALVGPTGSGKSTFSKLLTRMYRAPDRSILVDDVPIEQWDLPRLRRSVGVVQQDVVILPGTLLDNVTLGRPIAPEAALKALQDAQLGPLVQRLGGMDVKLDNAGAGLSAGERQLLSIARLLADDPPIAVLDEATANIDSETEMRVQIALDRVLTGRTAVVVAHRLSTIRKAHRIIVLRRGEIIEQGNHAQLLELGGLYAHLVASAEQQGVLID